MFASKLAEICPIERFVPVLHNTITRRYYVKISVVLAENARKSFLTKICEYISFSFSLILQAMVWTALSEKLKTASYLEDWKKFI